MGDVDAYLETVAPDVRAALGHVADLVREVAPNATQGTSYGAPAFRHAGRPLLGFRAASTHLSLFPFSSEVVAAVEERLAGYRVTKGAVHFTPDRPVPDDVVRDLVRLRLAELTG